MQRLNEGASLETRTPLHRRRAVCYGEPTKAFMKVGDRVRVKESIIVYHHPEHRNEPFDLQGQEGEIIALVNEWQGKPISANFPLQVKFGAKFRAHLRENELEPLPD